MAGYVVALWRMTHTGHLVHAAIHGIIWTSPGWGKTLRARGALGLGMDWSWSRLGVLHIYDV